MWTSFALALRIITNAPPLTASGYGRDDLRKAVMLFPLVGALVGVVTAAAWVLGARFWPGQPLVAGTVAVAAQIAITGARGFGAVGRCVDALLGFREDADAIRALTVLREPRRSSGGVAGITVALLLAAVLMSALPPDTAWLRIAVASCLGQWVVSFVFAVFGVVPTWNNGDIEEHTVAAGPNELSAAMMLAIMAAFTLRLDGLIALVAVSAVTVPSASAAARSFNGLNIYFAYALGLLGELIALAVLSARP